MVTLWSSIKQVKAPYMFDGEHRIALHAMHGNPASSQGEEKVSWFFTSCCGNLVHILDLQWGWPFKTPVCSATSGLLSSYEGYLRNLHEAWQGNTDASRGDLGNRGSLSTCHTVILGFLSIVKKTQASSPFEALNSTCLLRCQRDVWTPVQMRQVPRAFFRISKGDSDIPSS